MFFQDYQGDRGKSKVDDDVLDNLEEVLITSDVGVDTTLKIIDRIEKRVARDKYVTTQEIDHPCCVTRSLALLQRTIRRMPRDSRFRRARNPT